MSKTKSIAVLFSVSAAALLSACDPAAMMLDPKLIRPDWVCADQGDGHCPDPEPTRPIKQP